MTFQPRMTSTVEGITLLEDLRWRRWNGVIADVWNVECAAGASGHYVSRDARLFVVLEREGSPSDVQLSADGTTRMVRRTPHRMSFVPADMPLWSRVEEPVRVRHLDLHFHAPTLSERLGEDLDPARLSAPRLDFLDERIFALSRMIAHECMEPDRHHDLYGDGLTLALFIDLLELGRRPTAGEAARRALLSARQLRRVTDFIEANCARNIRLQELADLTGLSQSYFSHAFKAATGVPPYQWHMKARLRKVQALLADHDLPLTEIAASTGFADQAHLTRAFRRLTGSTPAAWRRAYRK
ncbi:AraC family transcriptional regulator [Ancylobacter sp. MQZ15Z-1]|uniref:AraC family transcriptional regulator n=1 Tax=Ancylobacter mangrovi TaxID=2972472 RepID=A0A9X2T335_9HYPH|nr:AraC family transcriptional regulator [Ancylobacter mangrovi]MCS0494541.1 AraC family transcriptional regulator [Ancylobacter mangrovi]